MLVPQSAMFMLQQFGSSGCASPATIVLGSGALFVGVSCGCVSSLQVAVAGGLSSGDWAHCISPPVPVLRYAGDSARPWPAPGSAEPLTWRRTTSAGAAHVTGAGCSTQGAAHLVRGQMNAQMESFGCSSQTSHALCAVYVVRSR